MTDYIRLEDNPQTDGRTVERARGAELGKAVGYECGFKYGRITGSLIAIGTGIIVCTTRPINITIGSALGAAFTGALGYLAGGIAGANLASESCKRQGEKMAEEGKTEQQIIDYCNPESVKDGIIGGALASVVIGTLPQLMCTNALSSLGNIEPNISDTLDN